jgi:glycosyltransferase involved in cell wall biosynthesis
MKNWRLRSSISDSSDATLVKLAELVDFDVRVRVIDLSRNFGKEAALAGLDEALGDAVIPIDADLQDPPELIPKLILRWREGFDVVLAGRTDRQSDAFLKRKTAEFFYRFHNRISYAAFIVMRTTVFGRDLPASCAAESKSPMSGCRHATLSTM